MANRRARPTRRTPPSPRNRTTERRSPDQRRPYEAVTGRNVRGLSALRCISSPPSRSPTTNRARVLACSSEKLMTTKVILVDDHHLFRAGLRAVLTPEADISVVGEASEARQAYALLDSAQPALVVLDLTLPDGDGVAATREIIRREPRARVLILTMQTNELFVSRAGAAGASGFAIKSQGPQEILQAIRSVAAGERYVSPQFTEK